MSSVLVVGSINVDLHLLLQRHVLPGETLLASGGTYSPGGKGANQACAAQLAGAHTALMGAVGDDASSTVALAGLRQAGVDLGSLQEVPGPTGLAVVSVDATGENTVVVVPGANALVTPEMVDGWADAISAADVVVLQGEISAESDLAVARHTRGRLMLNLAPAIDVDPELLRRADPLVVNEHEAAAALAQLGAEPIQDPIDAIHALLAAGVASVVLTLGADGSLIGDGEGVIHVAAPRVTAVDTVGAGDAFTGALAARLSEGMPLVEAAAYASRFAAYTVQFEGAQASYPPLGQELPG